MKAKIRSYYMSNTEGIALEIYSEVSNSWELCRWYPIESNRRLIPESIFYKLKELKNMGYQIIFDL